MKKAILTVLFLISLAAASNAETVLQEIVVKDGDTLWGVANKFLKDPQSWPEILKFNKLPTSDPNVILPGMKLKIPILLVKEQYRSAKLIKLLNKVFYRKKEQVNWEKAYLDLMLYSDDGIRTLPESIASVKFYSGEIVKLEENSLVILRPEQKIDEVELLTGAVRASKSKVISAETQIMPQILPRGESPDFKTRIKPDKTTLVEVYKGIVDVTAQGKTVTLKEGFGTEVKYLRTPSSPFELPPQIKVDDAQPLNADNAYKIPALPGEYKKGAAKGAKVIGNLINKYHIQIAKDKNFENIIFDKVADIGKSNIDFKKLGLPDSKYYFHISYIDELGLEGPFSNPNALIIDTSAPAIIIDYPAENAAVDKELILLQGRTEPESKIVVNDEIASINSDGSFSQTISAKMGGNTVYVEVTDAAGNISKTSRVFTRVEKGSAKAAPIETAEKQKRGKFSLGSIALGILSISVIVGVVMLIIA